MRLKKVIGKKCDFVALKSGYIKAFATYRGFPYMECGCIVENNNS